MAEVFGVAASALGIVGVAGQALDGVRKLRQFYKDARDAPEEIQYIIDELELLVTTIATIEMQVSRNSQLSQDFDPSAALQFCRRSVDTTQSIVKELNDEIAKHKNRGSLKAAWKKKTLDTYMARIERTKSSLSLAVSVYKGELSHRNYRVTRGEADHSTCSTTVEEMSAVCHVSSGTASHDVSKAGRDDEGAIKCYPTPIRYGGHSTTVVRLELRMPTWVFLRSWKIDIYRAVQGWNITLRTYRTVPEDCDLFTAIYNLDVSLVCTLLQSGRASVFDRSPDGYTALHCTAIIGSIYWESDEDTMKLARIAQLLSRFGSDSHVQDDEGGRPFQCYMPSVLTKSPRHRMPASAIELYRTLVGGNSNDAEFSLISGFTSLELPFTTDVAIVEFIKQQFYPHGANVALDVLREDVLFLTSNLCLPFVSPASLAIWLGVEDLSTTLLESKEVLQRDILFAMVQGYASATGIKDVNSVGLWRDIVRNITSKGIDLCAFPLYDTRPVTNLVVGFVKSFVASSTGVFHGRHRSATNQRVDLGFTSFVEEMQAVGLDVGRFGSALSQEMEMCTADTHFEWQRIVSPGMEIGIETIRYRVYGCRIGLRAEESNIWVSSLYDERVGQFWDMIEHPERAMPGAWLPDNDDDWDDDDLGMIGTPFDDSK